ncbi:MAG: amidophosphoribosyltransferase [Candidatus Eisenbacteria bacterium]|nr:amidophosphoribosyltransferase [Candidatus Eisenbacteria bacterium]
MSELQEKCGLVGAVATSGCDVVESVYLGLYALQHRGQAGAGIVSRSRRKTRVHRGMGLVSEIFTPKARDYLAGHMAIGHNRYATTGRATKLRNVQPLLVDYQGGKLAIAHNGTLVNAVALRREMESLGSIFQTTTDSELILHLAARSREPTMVGRLTEALGQVAGAVTILAMDERTLVGYRDPFGFRPLVLGRTGEMILLASETCAFDLLGADCLGDVQPGEMVTIEAGRIERRQIAPPKRPLRQCIFEHIYFARPDSHVFGESVNRIRRELGAALARRHPADADLVIAVPDSSNAAALGYSLASGIPFELGLIRNHYVGRTFIQAGQAHRVSAVRLKFNPVRAVLEGQRVVVVDDSIVRGTTSRQLVQLLRKGGAREIHFRVASPPIQNPCFYGIDTPTWEELIAAGDDVEAIRAYVGATTLGYLTEADLLASVSHPDDYCLACFSGEYPTEIPARPDRVPFDSERWRRPSACGEEDA